LEKTNNTETESAKVLGNKNNIRKFIRGNCYSYQYRHCSKKQL